MIAPITNEEKQKMYFQDYKELQKMKYQKSKMNYLKLKKT